jgi:DUF4097 and DUF4098 domain-containing protein YvlB
MRKTVTREYTFDTPRPLAVYVENAAGDITVRSEETTATQVVIRTDREDVADRTTVALDGDRLRVEAPNRRWSGFTSGGIDMDLVVPAGSTLEVKAASADLHVRGTLSGLDVTVASGDVTAEQVTGDASVQGASGDITLGPVGGAVTAKTASGDLRLAGGDRISASTASGDIEIGTVTGSLTARTASGDVRIGDAAGGEIGVMTASGDIGIAVRPGTALKLEMFSRTGSVRSELPVDDLPPETGLTLDLRLQSTTGDITLRRGTAG